MGQPPPAQRRALYSLEFRQARGVSLIVIPEERRMTLHCSIRLNPSIAVLIAP